VDDEHFNRCVSLHEEKGGTMNRRVTIAALALASSSLCSFALAGGPPTYRVVKLNVEPMTGDGDAQATAIAEIPSRWTTGAWISVQVARGGGVSRAVMCSADNVCVDPFPDLPPGSSATAVDINHLGKMVGLRQDPGQSPFAYAAQDTTVFTAFGPLKNGCPQDKGFIPQAISNSNYIHGVAPGCHGNDRPAYFHKYGLRVASGLERAVPDATAFRYFDADGGAVTFPDGHTEAFLAYRTYQLLGTLGGRNSATRAVRWDYAVGCSDTDVPGEEKAFWAGGPNGQPMTALPEFGDGPTCAMGVTRKPIIVGNGQKSTQPRPSTAFYYRDGVMHDLNDLLRASDRKFHILHVAGITPTGNIAATVISDEDPRTVAVRLEVVEK
jgi:hypothetical protein